MEANAVLTDAPLLHAPFSGALVHTTAYVVVPLQFSITDAPHCAFGSMLSMKSCTVLVCAAAKATVASARRVRENTMIVFDADIQCSAGKIRSLEGVVIRP